MPELTIHTSARESPTVNICTAPNAHRTRHGQSKIQRTPHTAQAGQQPLVSNSVCLAQWAYAGNELFVSCYTASEMFGSALKYSTTWVVRHGGFTWRCDCGRRIQGESTGWSSSCLCTGLPLIQWPTMCHHATIAVESIGFVARPRHRSIASNKDAQIQPQNVQKGTTVAIQAGPRVHVCIHMCYGNAQLL